MNGQYRRVRFVEFYQNLPSKIQICPIYFTPLTRNKMPQTGTLQNLRKRIYIGQIINYFHILSHSFVDKNPTEEIKLIRSNLKSKLGKLSIIFRKFKLLWHKAWKNKEIQVAWGFHLKLIAKTLTAGFQTRPVVLWDFIYWTSSFKAFNNILVQFIWFSSPSISFQLFYQDCLNISVNNSNALNLKYHLLLEMLKEIS